MRFNYENMTLKERSQILDLIELVPAERRAVAVSLMREILTLSDILADTRKEIQDGGTVVHFGNDNVKENPAVKTYVASVGKYGTLWKQFLDLIPDGVETSELEDFISA